MNLREIALDNLAYRLAFESIGIYPQAVKGGKNPYEKRTERMEGHNEVVTQISKIACDIEEFLSKCDCKTEVEDALLEEQIFVLINKEEGIKLYVNCNDVFYWACSDLEEIKPEELKDLAECGKSSESYGSMLWCCRKRKMRPQKPWYDGFSEEEKNLFNACGAEREE